MNKKNLKHIPFFLLAILFIISCRKETMETEETTESNSAVNSANRARENTCRTTVDDWATAARFEFHYNDRGLADQWIVDYGSGLPLHTNEMTYDNNDRLVQSDEYYFGSNYVYQFYYTGKLLTRLTRVNVDNTTDAIDVLFTYNSKGQNTRQDDDVNDSHVLMTYDNIGNCTRTDLYFGTELVFSDIYSFSIPARSPRSAVHGIETGFIAYGPAGFTDKWWFTSNRTEFYDNGTLILFNDYDPAHTNINIGNHNYPNSATYYDRVTEAPITMSFDYENCNGNVGNEKTGNSQSNRSAVARTSNRYVKPFLTKGTAKSVKEQIKRIKQALEYKWKY